MPRLTAVVGLLIAIGGLITPFLGAAIATVILDKWASGGDMAVRLSAGAGMLLAAFVAWSVAGKR